MSHSVALFHTTSAVFRAEKLFAQCGILYKLIPTPRQLSSECGIALRFDADRCEEVHALLERAHLETAGIHTLA